ncbi:MAG: DUF1292 domain-containing protein [Ruminococcus sp.]|jgi:uncharacterized protein YrzB (UPF0473 family)|nr:DUF1292 domain-containing protein [Ruminococcus sp.]
MADLIKENPEDEVIIIELTDEDGVSTEFEYLDTIQLDGEEYVVLIENDEDAEGVIILKIESIDDESENYIGIDDEETVQKVYEIFKKNHKDDFEFTD